MLTALYIVAAWAVHAQAVMDTARPNIIVVLADDVGYGDVGYNERTETINMPAAGDRFYEPNPPKTPHLDEMFSSDNTIVFDRFYAGSGVCSPTRSSILTGRTSYRECITGAEGCGTSPAWQCVCPYPLPPTSFTVAEAAKQLNYSTVHFGKWHLGDFFPKTDIEHASFSQLQWPASHPGMHGFDEWNSTEASAPSTTTNCGCNPFWKEWFAGGCITGGGQFAEDSYPCTNYWTQVSDAPECYKADTTTLQCVANLTEKIPGDDTQFIMDRFESYLDRRLQDKSPFMAMLWLHTVHMPHPALPEFFHAYTDRFGRPAGDYLGTITQMDVQIGRLRQMLRDKGIANNTLLWFTSDNGPHIDASEVTFNRTAEEATNGLRQCKASLFEGGIRVPGMIEWPAVVKKRRVVSRYPAYVSDILPTVLDILNLSMPDPTWTADGQSLLPLISNASFAERRTKPLVFFLNGQTAIIDNNLKIVHNPVKGQCPDWQAPFNDTYNSGPFLFDLDVDPTETYDLSTTHVEDFKRLVQTMSDFHLSVGQSQVYESGCSLFEPTFPPIDTQSPTAQGMPASTAALPGK